jgi:UPF0716 family protein affecting phage T7 exclusion
MATTAKFILRTMGVVTGSVMLILSLLWLMACSVIVVISLLVFIGGALLSLPGLLGILLAAVLASPDSLKLDFKRGKTQRKITTTVKGSNGEISTTETEEDIEIPADR